MEAALNPTPDLAAAQAAWAGFLRTLDHSRRIVGAHDVDADGISAGVLWLRTLERLGFSRAVRVLPDQERSVWTPANRSRIAAAQPDTLVVMDLGSQATPIIDGIPTCFIDHHRPEGVPDGDTLVSAYSWDPIPTTSLLMWEICRPLADISDLDWIAAIGVIGDLGERAPFSLLDTAKKKYTAKYLKETVSLVNATRRSSHPDPEAAARALMTHTDPRELVTSSDPDVSVLRSARDEVKAAMEDAKRAAPVFSGQVALIRVHSACQIHPLVAQIWRSRLPKYIVIAANDGYLPNRVNFSARSASGINVLEFLRAQNLPPGEGNFGNGHDQASGGSLPPDRWSDLLVRMGFLET